SLPPRQRGPSPKERPVSSGSSFMEPPSSRPKVADKVFKTANCPSPYQPCARRVYQPGPSVTSAPARSAFGAPTYVGPRASSTDARKFGRVPGPRAESVIAAASPCWCAPTCVRRSHLGECQPVSAPVTLLFTDLVNSTELLQRVGDERAQRIFRAHHRLLKDTAAAHGGEEVKWLG